MSDNKNTYHYNKIAEAIEYLDEHFKKQPSLDDIAEHIHLSPHHFQRLFKDWVGVSPKKYIQYLSLNYAKKKLKKDGNTLFDTALETGLSGTSRLHDLFINIEGMTPGEYKNGGKTLNINYSYAETQFGDILVATTKKGICHIAFVDNKEEALQILINNFPNANYEQKVDKIQQEILKVFLNNWDELSEIKLHLKGTDFQLKVWEALLTIPKGKLATYGEIAKKIAKPNAQRAVGTAIGSNPIAYLIPCHRVIQSSGKTGGYRWNPIRKKAILGWEAAKTSV
ncbi:methylated-DNA--[protein]-cysteine S-methyltransferase [Tenacibaculum aiptasiae]|uniref:methylated-DNA--[protein]-cysteine S-methyltransferase n=1 Tax=Tenacibaculum aiptasiae TaxID=426481 RepID=A0A7J5AAK0_9FLAO|nr:methylated-DNA--[protein]-cysteine S-methyltransferase [Tenacibaculum aiptasiae]KAB1154209.1 methylated-DNA--[protein]-cysteine S-methyltransferase [Tenacibaculum aiptasiae]